MGKLTVLNGGLFTTIQDGGREGYRKFGVPVSGIMDEQAYKLANEMVGNATNEPVLECTLKGGEYRFDEDAIAVLTGAPMNPQLNNEPVNLNAFFKVNRGDILKLGFAEKGCRTYVAIRGRWKVPKVMESCSACTMGNFGGLFGRALEKGDTISWEKLEGDFDTREILSNQMPYYSSKITVNFISGPEWNWLDEKTQNFFLNTSFKVHTQSNRMGIRLRSDESIKVPDKQITSSGVIPGIIQLPPSGQPIILMKDGQTIGGYLRIGKVLDIHLNRLAQIPPNGYVRFKKTFF